MHSAYSTLLVQQHTSAQLQGMVAQVLTPASRFGYYGHSD